MRGNPRCSSSAWSAARQPRACCCSTPGRPWSPCSGSAQGARHGNFPLALSAVGTGAVVAAGVEVSISPAGIVFALGSAAVFALYVLVGARLGARCDPMVTAAWVAAGASASSLTRGALTGELVSPAGHWHVLVIYGVFTAAAFTLMFAAMARIGAGRTSVVMTLEALSAAVLAGLFLAEPLTPEQGLGGAAVLAAAVMVALTRGDGPLVTIDGRKETR
ncbi:MAG: EamA family transporter [Egibacteraceae bacterium]